MQCFTVSSDEIEGRLDVFYYQPEFIELERKIKKHSSKTLGDFIINLSGGATPEKDEAEKYYTDSPKNGVPFLRVQNVTENGLSLDDCKFINFDTHSGMLKRSQVKEGDLITKITGVGRMAVSTVAPAGFDGNINQHLVAIKTDSCQTSEVLAAFLNSDIGERLAFRRSTGGTRPALDYQALKTIPIVFNANTVAIMESAYEKKKQKEEEAHRLLDSIDGYVLDELGIKLPEVEEKMCFAVSSEEVQENRADAFYYQPRFVRLIEAMRKSPFEIKTLGNLAIKVINGFDFREFIETGIPYLRVSNIKPNSFDTSDVKFIPAFSISKDIELENEDLLITRKGTYGNSVIVDDEHKRMVISSEIFRVVLKKDNVNPHYVAIWLNNNIAKQLFNRISTGGIMGHLSQDALKNIQIILPSLEIQNKIAEEVEKRISEAERLKAEAGKIIEEAKKKVEEMILGSN